MEDIDLELLGRRILRLRTARGMGRQELADVIGVSTRTVANWEKGRNSPINSLGALERVLGVDDLLAETVAQEDAVVAAIERSDLTRADKATLVGTYYRMLDTQGEVRGA